MPELLKLICNKDENWTPRQVSDAVLDSSWLDFASFADLLGVKPARLRECFLDKIGFLPFSAKGYGIRHCSKCWEYGYHCTLFDLAMVKECPWHQIELATACLSCATMSAIGGSRNFAPVDTCPHCRRSHASAYLENGKKKFTAAERKIIRAFCNELIDWKARITDTLPHPLLTGDLDAVGRQGIESLGQQLQLGLAVELGQRMPNWTLIPTPIPVQLFKWNQGQIQSQAELSEKQQVGNLILVYKAIRRQIAKRYLCGHARCLAEVMRLRRSESLYIAGDRICPAAFAYIIWRMSVEGVIDIERLRGEHPINLHFGLNGSTDVASMVEQLYRFYSLFFAIWGITALLGPRDRYELRLEEPLMNEKLPTWRIVEDVRNDGSIGDVFALVPRAETLRVLSQRQCKRWPRLRSIAWSERFWSADSPASYSADEQRFVMFRMRAMHALSLSQYYQLLRI